MSKIFDSIKVSPAVKKQVDETAKAIDQKQAIKQPLKSFNQLAIEHFEWTKKMFPAATGFSSLQKCKEEIREIEADINLGHNVVDETEYVDAIMCLLDSAGRRGISFDIIHSAFERKLEINKNRIWVDNGDGTYSHKPNDQ
ncbi:dATP/dGTP pyrophosphohydrolase domain-containing protein [Roseivirga seohaensis]|uniref:dATP/dGTP pyrophosphohydrolase domain-containing protein n=1 Tax=Roseivirga seohaensis TaxID=1914963 RepID=UPI003BAAE8B5